MLSKRLLKRLYLLSYDLLYIFSLLGKSVRISISVVVKKLTRLLRILPSREVITLKAKIILFGTPSKIIKLSSVSTGLLSFFLTGLIALLVFSNLPTPQDLINRSVNISTKIYDRNGNLLYKIYKDENRTLVKLDQIPNHVINATLAVEDAEFYSHKGFSVRGIARSVIKNVREQKLTGGSTITQQLVKNTLLSPEKTVWRKLREVVLSVQVEATFTKDQILEMYMNEVSYGNSAYGIEEASQVYFAKQVNQLNVAEAALLAGLPKSPTFYSPFGQEPTRALDRQKEVLNLMKDKGFISEDEAKIAFDTPIAFATKGADIKAPHFVMYVRELLAEKYGEGMIERGGLEVITTLDLGIQQMAEAAVKKEVEKLRGLNVTNGSALVIHPQTGEILAMVGSKDYFDETIDGNVNVTLRPRSPGSSIKPIVYSYALEHGMTPATIIADSPTSFSLPGQPAYVPKNYDDTFRGNITLRSALAESRNIPAVKVLVASGLQNIIEHGREMGIESWVDESRYGPSLTLGGGEVKLLELAQAYTIFANFGRKVPISAIKSIKNYKNKLLDEGKCVDNTDKDCVFEQVIDPRVAFLITDILRDNNARSPSFGSNSMLVVPKHAEIAVKTGTSNDLRDNLTVGFNQKYLVAVWVGNNDNAPMHRIASGVTGAAPIWNTIMSSLIASDSNHSWDPPPGVIQVSICALTGTLPCSGCPSKTDWFLEENAPKHHCRMENLPSPTPAN